MYKFNVKYSSMDDLNVLKASAFKSKSRTTVMAEQL